MSISSKRGGKVDETLPAIKVSPWLPQPHTKLASKIPGFLFVPFKKIGE
jgi:hypothetical protein